jgi:hypothetical protein
MNKQLKAMSKPKQASKISQTYKGGKVSAYPEAPQEAPQMRLSMQLKKVVKSVPNKK